MRLLRTASASIFAIATTTALAHTAAAFCGFYVSGADQKLFADSTQVVLMREGTKTVLSMQNDYKGPPEKFALVIPVPVVLTKDNVKVLPREVFDKIDKLGAPRLVEYWEQDPCPSGLGSLGHGAGIGTGQGFGSGAGRLGGSSTPADLGVKIEAKFAVGEYEVVVLSAVDSSGLDKWLKQEHYAIPEGAEPYFKPYITAGMKFFVAKVDVSKVKLENGRATLSPLRFHYDSERFSLPVRLGLINSSGKQDLIVNLLAKQQRYEVANYPNATIPTNLDVTESARGKFGEFYASLFDRVLEKAPKAVVTEYSWDPGTCDPCPGPTLDADDLATLGADVLGTQGLSATRAIPSIRQGAIEVRGLLPSEVIQRIVRQNFGRFRLCYEEGQRRIPTLSGKVAAKFVIGIDGAVKSSVDAGGDLADPTVHACVARSFKSLSFPRPGGEVEVVYPILFAPTGGLSGRFGMTPYVLTRLHARYDRDTLGEDLVFRAAPPISGGREVWGADRKLESGAMPATTNNFQGRYAIRHPWTGAITCKEPIRGMWGGPPAGAAPAPLAAQKAALAYAPRGTGLATFVTAPLAELDVRPAVGMGEGTDAGTPVAPIPNASTSAIPATPAGTIPPATAPKRGCNASGGSASVPMFGLLLALPIALRRRVRASRRAH